MTPIEQAIEALELSTTRLGFLLSDPNVSVETTRKAIAQNVAALSALRGVEQQPPRTPIFWKSGDELLPFHHQASHVNPDYRDGWNACWYALKNDTVATPPPAPVLLTEAEKYRECLEWVRAYISRYDPPGLPNHIAQKIDAALSGDIGAES